MSKILKAGNYMGCRKGPLLPSVKRAQLREDYLSYWLDTDNYEYRPNRIDENAIESTPIVNTTTINGKVIDKDKVVHLAYTVGMYAPSCFHDIEIWLSSLHAGLLYDQFKKNTCNFWEETQVIYFPFLFNAFRPNVPKFSIYCFHQ